MTNKYIRTIKGVEIDIYDILAAWGVTCPATQHAIKKLMMPGQRGGKGKAQDLTEARDAVLRAIELEGDGPPLALRPDKSGLSKFGIEPQKPHDSVAWWFKP